MSETETTVPKAEQLAYEPTSVPVISDRGSIRFQESPTEWLETDETNAILDITKWA